MRSPAPGRCEVDGGGDLILNTASVGTGQTVSFSGAAGILTFGPNDIGGFAGTIAGFTAGDEIVLDNASLTSVSAAGSALTLFGPGGTTLGTLNFASAADAAAAAQPGAVTTQAICFLAGTRIATPGGEIAVECLAAGDAVVTLRGEVRRIAWVGCGKVLATRGCRSAATPVIVRKGALADNVPHRDLRITKGHSLYVDDVLIPVEFLVNHRSIVWDDHAQEVSIYHVELDSHDVLIANGAPAESYRDDGNRWLFQNANSGWELPAQPPCAPGTDRWPSGGCRVASAARSMWATSRRAADGRSRSAPAGRWQADRCHRAVRRQVWLLAARTATCRAHSFTGRGAAGTGSGTG